MEQRVVGGLSRRSFLFEALKWGTAAGLSGAALTAFLEACAGSAAPQKGTSISGTLKVDILGTSDLEKLYTDYWGFFKTQYPGITIQPHAIPFGPTGWTGFIDAVNTEIAGGNAPDLVQVAVQGLLQIAPKSLPIDEYMSRDATEIKAIFADMHPSWPKWLGQSSPPGKQYFLPGADFNTMVIYYNADIFREAGVPDPPPTWTWSDFADVCAKVSKGKNRYAYNIDVIGGQTFQSLCPWLNTNGTNILSDDWKTAKLDQPAAIEAVQFERMLVQKGYIPTPGGQFDQYAAAVQGKLAMLGGGRWPSLSLKDQLNSWKILPWPQNKTQGTPLGWTSSPIIASTQYKDAAWTFAKSFSNKDSSNYFDVKQLSVGVPTHASLIDQWVTLGPVGVKHLYEALDYAQVAPSPLQANQMELLIADALVQMLIGNKPVPQGMTELNQKVQAIL